MTSKLKVEQIAHTNNVSAMTIDSSGLITGAYLKPTTEGLVTTTAAQNNIQFTIPSGANRIEIQIYKFSPVNSEEMYVRMGNPTALTSGYDALSIYEPHGSNANNISITNAFRINGFNANNNIHNFMGWGWSPDDGRRWHFNFEVYNTQYPTNHLSTRGLIDMGSGQTLQRVEIESSGSGGFDAGGLARVYYGKI